MHLADVESDMSVFHRIDDVRSMPARQFIDLALRLAAYKGVLRLIVEQEARESENSPNAPLGARRDGNGKRQVSSDRATLTSDPGLGGMFEVRKGAGDGGQGVQAS